MNAFELLGVMFIVVWLVLGLGAFSLLVHIKNENKTWKIFLINFLLGPVALICIFSVITKD